MKLTRSGKVFGPVLVFADLIVLETTLLAAYAFRYGLAPFSHPEAPPLILYVALAACAAGVWVLVFFWLELGELRDGWRFSSICSQALVAWVSAGGLLLVYLYFAKLFYSRLALGIWAFLSIAALVMVRAVLGWLIPLWRKLGRRVVLFGSYELVSEAGAMIERHPQMLYELVGVLCPAAQVASLKNGAAGGVLKVKTLVQSVESLAANNVDELFVLLTELPNTEVLNFITACRARGIAIKVLPQPYELYVSRLRVLDFAGLPLLELSDRTFSSGATVLKRVFDVCVAFVLLVLLAPLMCAICSILRIAGARPVLIRRPRIGKNGTVFSMYQFNTSISHFALRLKKYSLGELPQLLNVLKGEMSLVGPRPETPQAFKHYSDWHRRRLEVLPGITGLAQVFGCRQDSPIEEKIRHDLAYILNWSLLRDVLILLETIWTVLGRLREPVPVLQAESAGSPPGPTVRSAAATGGK